MQSVCLQEEYEEKPRKMKSFTESCKTCRKDRENILGHNGDRNKGGRESKLMFGYWCFVKLYVFLCVIQEIKYAYPQGITLVLCPPPQKFLA